MRSWRRGPKRTRREGEAISEQGQYNNQEEEEKREEREEGQSPTLSDYPTNEEFRAMKKRGGCLYRAAGVFVGVVVWLVLEQGLGLSSVFSWLIACITAIVLWLALEGRAERKSEWTNLNRIYNLYLARDFGEMRSGPCTQIILCDLHAERFKKIVKKDPGNRIYRSRPRKKGITPFPCDWCENPEEFEDMEAGIGIKKTDEAERL